MKRMNKLIKRINAMYIKHYDYIKYLNNHNTNFTIVLLIGVLLKFIWLKIYQFVKLLTLLHHYIQKRYWSRLLIFLCCTIILKYLIKYLWIEFFLAIIIMILLKVYVIDYLNWNNWKKFTDNYLNNFLINYQLFLENKIKIRYKYILKKNN